MPWESSSWSKSQVSSDGSSMWTELVRTQAPGVKCVDVPDADTYACVHASSLSSRTGSILRRWLCGQTYVRINGGNHTEKTPSGGSAQYHGLWPWLIILETTQVQQQDQLASAAGNIALNLVNVYRALGGGWEIRCQKEQSQRSTESEHGDARGAPREAPAALGPESLPEPLPAPRPVP